MSKFLARTVRLVAVGALVGAGAVTFASPAHAGGNCDVSDLDCNQTVGETCVTASGRPPGGGYVYHDICADTSTDWKAQTPNCSDVDAGCGSAMHTSRPTGLKTAPKHHR